MRDVRLQASCALLCFLSATAIHAQQLQSTTAVPKIVRFNGSFRPVLGPSQSSPSVESVTLSVYRDQTGGSALWQEVQSVSVDTDGHYSLLMGSTLNEGMPMELFTSAEPRWLGVQFSRPGEVEQPRVLLASVPYALKASDSETLGGRPASAYLLAETSGSTTGGAASSNSTGSALASTTPATAKTAVTPKLNSGTAGAIGVFANSTDLVSSVMVQANGFIGVGTVPGAGAATVPSLDLRTAPFSQIGMAQTTDYLTFFASDSFGPAIYWDPAKDLRLGKGGVGLYNAFGFTEQVRIQSSTGNLGIGTQNPSSKLDVGGDINFSGALSFQGSPLLRPILGGNSLFTDNLGVGIGALQNNTTGTFNMAIGTNALQANTTGLSNMAMGNRALLSNTTGSANSATGVDALRMNLTGNDNTADGNSALNFNTSGGENTAIGATALFQNTVGNRNIAVGSQALLNNTAGGSNTAIGYLALSNNVSGNSNIAIGFQAGNGVTGSNNIHIGNAGLGGDNAFIRIGTPGTHTAFFTAGIRGVTTGSNDAIPVVIDSNGQLGTVSSSRRFKEDIEDMGGASDGLMRLRPVTYRYKQPFADGSKPIQYGLIAEEVDEVYPELVAHSADGKIETVKYQVLDSMLLNEVQRQQAEIRKLEQQNQSLQERLAKIEGALSATPRP